MKKYFKIILPVFLFAILVTATVIFTKSRDSLGRLNAQTIYTCATSPTSIVYSGTCVCQSPSCTQTYTVTDTSYSTCSAYCKSFYVCGAMGTGSVGGNLSSANGITCPAGTYDATRGKCVYTTASGCLYGGTVISTSTTCNTGQYLNANGSACEDCPSSYPSSPAGATSINQCYKTCPAGKHYSTGTHSCVSCETGKYSSSSNTATYGNSTSCTNCPAGTYSVSSGIGDSITTCIDCPAGFYCPGGTNKQSCGSGKNSNAKAKSASDCYDDSSVTVPIDYIYPSANAIDLTVGGTKKIAISFSPSNATDKTYSWSNSNSSIATIDSSGNVTGKAVGSTTLTATANDKTNGTKTTTVTVKVYGCISCGGSQGATLKWDYSYQAQHCSIVDKPQSACSGSASELSNCLSNQYYDSTQSKCVSCPAAYPSSAAGANSESECYQSCPAGMYYPAGGGRGCVGCLSGTYMAAENKAYKGSGTSCTACPAGTYSHSSSTTEKITSCTDCPAGYYCPGNSDKVSCGSGKNSNAKAKSASDCYDDSSVTIAVTDITINKSSSSLTVGSKDKITASVVPTDASDKTYSWSTANSSIATVDSSGNVTGKAVGHTTITVTANDKTNGTKTATAQIYVYGCIACGGSQGTTLKWDYSYQAQHCSIVNKPQSACSGSLSNCLSNQYYDSTQSKCVSCPAAYPLSAAGANSVDECYQTCPAGQRYIDSTRGCGNCNAGQYSESQSTAYHGNTTSCTACPAGKYSEAGATSCLVCPAGYYCPGGSNKVSCGSGKTSNAGSTSASDCRSSGGGGGGGGGSVAVTGITVSPTSDEVEVGKTIKLTETISPSNATNKNVVWSSSDTTIATVNGGVVTGVKEGNVTITVTTESGNKKAESKITVKPASSDVVSVTGVKVNPTSGKVEEGATFALEAIVEPENASNKNVTWKSNDTSIATVKNGIVTGVKVGTTTITVTTEDGNKTANATIEVISSDSPENNTVFFDASSYTCEVGNSFTVMVRTSRPGLGVVKSVTSSDASIAKVEGFTVTSTNDGSVVKCKVDDAILEVGSVVRCISLAKTYKVSCLKAGNVTLTATSTDNVTGSAKVKVNGSGQKYSITFDANGGYIYYNNINNDVLTIEGASSTTLEQALAETTISRNGYKFLGWFTGKDEGVQVKNSTKFGEVGVSILYAQWELQSGAKFTLTYDSNGGNACNLSSKTVSANQAWGELCSPTRSGYRFMGWYTAKSGGSKITSSSKATNDLKVYAQWKKSDVDNPKTGISTPILALIALALISSVAFFAVRKQRTSL